MNKRLLVYSALVAFLLMAASMAFFDKALATFAYTSGGRSSVVLQGGTRILEVASGFPISRYALSFALLAVAAALAAWRSTRHAAWLVLFVGSSQLATRLIVSALKETFGRLRPFEVIANGTWDPHAFFQHGNAFPSGHTAHFWGLFFPLAFLFPRYRWPLLIVPFFIAVARVGVNDHWCSDVVGSIGIAALVTLLFVWLFRIVPRAQR